MTRIDGIARLMIDHQHMNKAQAKFFLSKHKKTCDERNYNTDLQEMYKDDNQNT